MTRKNTKCKENCQIELTFMSKILHFPQCFQCISATEAQQGYLLSKRLTQLEKINIGTHIGVIFSYFCFPKTIT